jgi:hypothetical protein
MAPSAVRWEHGDHRQGVWHTQSTDHREAENGDYRRWENGDYRGWEIGDYRGWEIGDYRETENGDYRQAENGDYREAENGDYREAENGDHRGTATGRKCGSTHRLGRSIMAAMSLHRIASLFISSLYDSLSLCLSESLSHSLAFLFPVTPHDSAPHRRLLPALVNPPQDRLYCRRRR